MAVDGLLVGACLGSFFTAVAAESPPNRLAGEHSPYLLQHAHDLVDWHPWGVEAFALARTSQRPIFLSIGFSTCHWCHVMELDLYESSFDPDRLSQAITLQDRQDLRFWDAAEGGYFATASDDPFLLVRLKSDRDEALPSANAVAVANLVRLATILDQPDRLARAAEIVTAFRGRLEQTPTAALQLLAESSRLAGPPTHVVIAGSRDAADTAALLRSVWRTPGTNRIVLLADGDERLAAISPLVRPIRAGAGSGGPRPATAHVCSGEIYHPPKTSPETLTKLLRELPPAGR